MLEPSIKCDWRNTHVKPLTFDPNLRTASWSTHQKGRRRI